MDSDEICQDGNKIPPIMALPEETMREIFNYLSIETLYISLRQVCKNIQTYVDRYLKARASSFLFGEKGGTEKEVIKVIKEPKKGLIILRGPVSSNSGISSKIQNNQSLNDYLIRRIDKMFYAEVRATGIYKMYKGTGLICRYDLESNKWEKLSGNCIILRCLDHNKSSHECIHRLVSEDFPYYSENDSYGHYNYQIDLSIDL